MDLQSVENYLCPQTLEEIPAWKPGWAWLAGGTWMFGEPQPQVKTLVDIQKLGWSELEVTSEGLIIGASCTMSQLLNFNDSSPAIEALKGAVRELASFKIQNVATIAGNICLAIPATTFPPAMVVLNASYEILSLNGESFWVSALDFQRGIKQTILKPGEVLRKIRIPLEFLDWKTDYQRFCMASAGIGISMVATAYHPQTQQVRFGIGGCIPIPQLMEFSTIPSPSELQAALLSQIPAKVMINDTMGCAPYRHHITRILMERSLQNLNLRLPSSSH